MQNSIIIYLRAVGIYALMTIITLPLPVMYFMSIIMVIIYGWFAYGVFFLTCLITDRMAIPLKERVYLLAVSIPVGVALSLQMIETFGAWSNVWTSGFLLLFPLGAVFSGWISLSISYQKVKKLDANPVFEFTNDNNVK